MSMLSVNVNKELAVEYCEKVRELFPMQYADLDNKALMSAFVENRLSEEIEFVEQELSSTC